MLTDADVTHRFCVTVTGTNAGGSTTLDCSGITNEIFPQTATQLTPAKLNGTAYVGDTLVSDVGTWKFPGTTYTRQWEQLRGRRHELLDDLGREVRGLRRSRPRPRPPAARAHRRRLQRPEQVPGRHRGLHAPQRRRDRSAPAAGRSDPDPDADPGPAARGQAVAAGGAGARTRPRPVLQSLGAVSAKLKPGAQLQLKVALTEGGTLSVDLQRVRAGRKVGKKCKPGAKKGKKCTVISKVATVNVGVAGSGIVALPKRKLAAGDYRAVVTPIDAAGNRGAARTIAFKVTKK